MPTPAAGSAGYVLAMVLSCGFFMACSAGMMIVNKMVRHADRAAAHTFAMPSWPLLHGSRAVWAPLPQVIRSVHMPNTIVMIQMAFTVLLLCAYPCGLHFGSLKDVKRWSLTVPWLFTVMLASSMLSLRYSSMGAIVVMRNISPLVSLCIEGVFTGEKIEIDVWTLLSLLVVLSGVVLYVSHDIAFSPIGMLCMIANLAAGVSAGRPAAMSSSVTSEPFRPPLPPSPNPPRELCRAPALCGARAIPRSHRRSMPPRPRRPQVFERLLQRKMIAVEPIDINKCDALPAWPRTPHFMARSHFRAAQLPSQPVFTHRMEPQDGYDTNTTRQQKQQGIADQAAPFTPRNHTRTAGQV